MVYFRPSSWKQLRPDLSLHLGCGGQGEERRTGDHPSGVCRSTLQDHRDDVGEAVEVRDRPLKASAVRFSRMVVYCKGHEVKLGG